jgi:hypothetical protein
VRLPCTLQRSPHTLKIVPSHRSAFETVSRNIEWILIVPPSILPQNSLIVPFNPTKRPIAIPPLPQKKRRSHRTSIETGGVLSYCEAPPPQKVPPSQKAPPSDELRSAGSGGWVGRFGIVSFRGSLSLSFPRLARRRITFASLPGHLIRLGLLMIFFGNSH